MLFDNSLSTTFLLERFSISACCLSIFSCSLVFSTSSPACSVVSCCEMESRAAFLADIACRTELFQHTILGQQFKAKDVLPTWSACRCCCTTLAASSRTTRSASSRSRLYKAVQKTGMNNEVSTWSAPLLGPGGLPSDSGPFPTAQDQN